MEELQRAWEDLRRRQERVERAEGEGRRHGEGRGPEGRPPLMPLGQPAIPPEQESEMQERAWTRIMGEVARLAERDREVAARDRTVRKEEEAVTRGAHRVLPDPEGDTPSTDAEGRSPSGKRRREEEGETWQERGKRRRVERRGAGGAEGAPGPASLSPEPTPTDWDSELPPPRQYVVRRAPLPTPPVLPGALTLPSLTPSPAGRWCLVPALGAGGDGAGAPCAPAPRTAPPAGGASPSLPPPAPPH